MRKKTIVPAESKVDETQIELFPTTAERVDPPFNNIASVQQLKEYIEVSALKLSRITSSTELALAAREITRLVRLYKDIIDRSERPTVKPLEPPG